MEEESASWELRERGSMRFECLALAASPHVLDSHGRAWVDLGEAGTTEKTAGRIIKCALVIRAASMCVLRVCLWVKSLGLGTVSHFIVT